MKPDRVGVELRGSSMKPSGLRNGNMKPGATSLLVIALAGCDGRINFGPDGIKADADIEKTCALVRIGMTEAEVDSMMVGASHTTISASFDGAPATQSEATYWKIPSDWELLKKEPMRAIIEQGPTCTAKLDAERRVVKVSYHFADEAEYQSIKGRAESN